MKQEARMKSKQRRKEEAETPLSSAVQLTSSKKLNAVGKGVTCIDNDLPEEILSAEVLYISRNKLMSLEGVQQFKFLKAVSAADNHLATLQSLAPLQHAHSLETANLGEGNPVSSIPNYRQHLICMLAPTLRSLDGSVIMQEERQSAYTTCALESNVMNALVSNACFVHKLGRALQVGRLHQELSSCFRIAARQGLKEKTGHGERVGEPASPVDDLAARVCRVADAWDYEESLGDSEREMIEKAICAEASLVSRRMKVAAGGHNEQRSSFKAWHECLCTVLVAQADAISGLVSMLMMDGIEGPCKSSIEAIEKVVSGFSNLCPTDPSAALQAGEMVDILRNKQKNLLKELIRASEDQWAISSAALDVVSEQIVHNDDEEDSLEVAEEPSINADAEDLALSAAVNELATAHLHIDELEMCIQQTTQDAIAAKRELAVYKQERSAQQEAIAAIQNWLENANAAKDVETARADAAERRLQEVLGVLGGLRIEMDELHERCIAAEYLAAASSAREDAVREELNQMQIKETEAALKSVETVQPVCVQLRISFENELESERVRTACLAERLAAAEAEVLAYETERQSALESGRVCAERAVLLAFRCWRDRVAAKARLHRIETKIKSMSVHTRSLNLINAWRTAAVRSQRLDTLAQKRRGSMLRATCCTWRAAARSAALFRSLETAAEEMSMLALQRRTLSALHSHALAVRQVDLPLDAPVFKTAAACRHKRAMGGCFGSWRSFTEQRTIQIQSAYLMLATYQQTCILRTVFTGWRLGAATAKEERVGAAARMVFLRRRVLGAWKIYCRRSAELHVAETQAGMLMQHSRLATAMAAWACWHQSLVHIRESRSGRELHKGLQAWREAVVFQIAERTACAKAMALERNHLFMCLKGWQAEASQAQSRARRAIRAERAMTRSTLARTLHLWRMYNAAHQRGKLSWKADGLECALEEASAVLEEKDREISELETAHALACSTASKLRKELDETIEASKVARQAAAQRQAQMQAAREESNAMAQESARALAELEEALKAEKAAKRAAEEAFRCASAEKEVATAAADGLISESLAAAAAAGARASAAEERYRAAEQQIIEAHAAVAGAKAESEHWKEKERCANAAYVQMAEVCSELKEAVAAADERASQASSRLERALEEVQHVIDARRALQMEVRELQGQLATSQKQRRAAVDAQKAAQADAAAAIRQAQRLADAIEAPRQNEHRAVNWV